MSAVADRLRELAANLKEPPHRVAGIPSGIISADDWDVTDEALTFLADARDMAVLLARALDALRAEKYDDWLMLREESRVILADADTHWGELRE